MFNPRHFLRMAKWAKRPPSEHQVKLFLGIFVICLILFGLERIFGWPEWLTLPDTPRGRIN